MLAKSTRQGGQWPTWSPREGNTMKSLGQWKPRSARDAKVAGACEAALRDVLPGSEVVLYGSRARGDAGPDSDFDLLVITPEPASPAAQRRASDAIYDVELEHEVIVSCLVCSRDEWNGALWRAAPLRTNIEREGVAL